MPRAAAIADRGGEGEEQQVAAGHERIRQAALLKGDRRVTGQRRVADLAEDAEIDDVVVAELAAPVRECAAQARDYRRAALDFDPVALAVIETDRRDRGKAFQCPGEAGCRILPPGEQNQRPFGACVDQILPGHPTRDSVSGGPYQLAAQRRVIVASK